MKSWPIFFRSWLAPAPRGARFLQVSRSAKESEMVLSGAAISSAGRRPAESGSIWI